MAEPAKPVTTWTHDDLARVEAAIAQGAVRVKYQDKEVDYMTLDNLFRVRREIQRYLNPPGERRNRGRRYAAVSKGIDHCPPCGDPGFGSWGPWGMT